jgi:hypothetical protein
MAHCQVNGCHYSYCHTTANHQCGICGQLGHGRSECGDPRKISALHQNYIKTGTPINPQVYPSPYGQQMQQVNYCVHPMQQVHFVQPVQHVVFAPQPFVQHIPLPTNVAEMMMFCALTGVRMP